MKEYPVKHEPSPLDAKKVEKLTALWQRSVEASHDFVDASEIAFYRPFVESLLPGFDVYTINRGRRIAAFAAVKGSMLEMLFVDAPYLGKGMGSQLLRQLKQSPGVDSLDVNEQNPRAIAFYERHGFHIVERDEQDAFGHPHPILHLKLG